jgi:chaperonin GroEL (HSP60 family)
MTLDENERSIHDALCVMRALYQKRFLVPGGGAPEAESAYQLGKVRSNRCAHAFDAWAVSIVSFFIKY